MADHLKVCLCNTKCARQCYETIIRSYKAKNQEGKNEQGNRSHY